MAPFLTYPSILLITISAYANMAAYLEISPRDQAGPPDRAALRETLKTLWDSLDTIELQETAGLCDDQLQFDTSQAYTRCDFARGLGGRFAASTVRINPPPKGERLVSDSRRSGGKHYFSEYFNDDTKTVSRLSISDDSETDEDVTRLPVRSMGFLTPQGKPLYRLLDDPATTIEEARDADGRRFIIMSARIRGNPYHMELDPGHDWLLRRYRIGELIECRVLRFESQNGRWFPVEGVMEDHRPEKRPRPNQPQRSKFEVTGLKLNQPISSSRFAPPPLPVGAIVHDDSKPKARVVGGSMRNRVALEKRHPSRTSKQPTSFGPIVARSEPEQAPWATILGGASLVLILGAGAFYAWRSWK